MIRMNEDDPDDDDRLGEAVEVYLALIEEGEAPDPDAFIARYPEIGDDLKAALEGLDMVQGLVGAPGRDLEAGRRIAGYKIVRELGRGGMGVVYEAVHVDLDRPVALKVLGTHAAPDSTGRRRFLNEAKTAAGLHHTHIVPVFDVGQVGGLCYYAMQRIEGSGLDRVLRVLRRDRSTATGSGSNRRSSTNSARNPAFDETASWNAGRLIASRSRASSEVRNGDVGEPIEDDDISPPFEPPRGSAYHRWVARLGQQAADALAHAHSRGIVHRDIKPSNLLVDARGTVWVADFGLSRRLSEIDPGLTRTDTRPGTPRYMSPEQTRAEPVDGRTDVYGLGATLYEMLALRPPFDGKNAVELARQIVEREAPPPRRFDRRLPRDLETIVLKAMAKRPSDRYGSAQELADDLGRFLATEPVRARRIGPIGRTWRLARRHPALSMVSTTAVMSIIAVASMAYVQVARERDRAVLAERNMQKALRLQFLSEATVVRTSAVPNRRERGLDLIHKAAALGPEKDLARRLRDEAVDFLALRDIVPRTPELAVGPIQGLSFAPVGGRLSTVSEDGASLDVWDAAARSRLARISLRTGPEPAPIETSPPAANPRFRSRSRLAPVGPGSMAVIRPDDQGIRLVDLATGASKAGPEVAIGRRIVSILASASSAVPRLVTIEVETRAPESPGSGAGRNAPQAGPAPGRGRAWVRLWDLEKPESPLKTLLSPEDWDGRGVPGLPSSAVSLDGSVFATARLRFDNAVRGDGGVRPGVDLAILLWSAVDGEKLGQISLGDDNLTSLALGPQGLLAAAGGGTIRLWNVHDPKAPNPLPSLSTHLSFVSRLRFSPDGTLLAATGSGSGVEVWDLATGAPAATLPTADRVVDLAFSPDGRGLAVANGEHGEVTSFWQIVEPLGRVRLQESRPFPSGLAFAPGGDLVIASSREPLRVWSPGDCPAAPRTMLDVRGSAVVFDAKGLPETPESIDPAPPSEGRGSSGRGRQGRGILPPDSILGRPGADRPEDRGPQQGRGSNGRGPQGGPPMAAIVRSRDGATTVVSHPTEFRIRRGAGPWTRLQTPLDSETSTFPTPPWRVQAISPLGDRLYVVNGRSAQAWSLSGDRARPLGWELPAEVASLALSPDGRLLALGENAGEVRLVNAVDGRPVHSLAAPEGESDDRVWSLAFSPDGDRLAVATRGRVRLWDLSDSTPQSLVRLPGHRAYVRLLAFSPDGRRLATSSDDPVVDVWDLSIIHRELNRLAIGW